MHLKITTTKNEKIIDSIGYKKNHQNAKSIIEETNIFSDKLLKIGYLENKIIENKKTNDSTFLFQYDLGNRVNFAHIYIGKNNSNLFETINDSITLKYNEIESFLNKTIQKLEKTGFGLAKVQLINIQKKKDYLIADLQITSTKKRNINDFVIKGYDKFPLGFKNAITKKYRSQIFNQDNLKKINADFNAIRFVKQLKYPEILFTTDSTKVFVYLEKAKTNSFDGFIGFANDETGKLIFNGYVDLALNNALNVGEKLALNWKSDGKDQKTFNVSAEIPYIFNSPIAIKTNLNIFKQDETYQNTKTAINLGYYINNSSKFYLGYQSTESNDIKNVNSNSLSDYENSYYTASYDFLNCNNPEASGDLIFPEKLNFNWQIGTGKRNSKNSNNKQFFSLLNLNYHLYLTKKTAINLKSQNFYLHSDTYIINELARFGGINSIRGFNENSLQASSYASIITEYQYLLSPSLYLHSILDYAYFEDKTSNISGKLSSRLFGIGIGFGLQTKNGLLNFVYANGSTNNQSNSIVHISLKTVF